jgi:hypothetical protein
MAARRLLIVMLVLLGLSTLAAALVPQHALRGTTGTASTTTTTATTTPAPPAPAGRHLYQAIVVGRKQPPVIVGGPICKGKPRCQPPTHVGDQLSLSVFANKGQAELSVPEFGLVSVASEDAPAQFELLFEQPGSFGIVFTSSGKVAARIDVLKTKAAKAVGRRANAKRRARAGSGKA